MSAAHKIQPGWYSIEGAAIYTGFTSVSIRNAIAAGHLPKRTVSTTQAQGKAVRIKREWLDAWIEGSSGTQPEKPFTIWLPHLDGLLGAVADRLRSLGYEVASFGASSPSSPESKECAAAPLHTDSESHRGPSTGDHPPLSPEYSGPPQSGESAAPPKPQPAPKEGMFHEVLSGSSFEVRVSIGRLIVNMEGGAT